MQAILLERIGRLGQMGDVVNVKDGYARNFLLPQKKALRATADNLTRFEKDRGQLEARDLELKKEAEAVAAKLGGKTFLAVTSSAMSRGVHGAVELAGVAGLADGKECLAGELGCNRLGFLLELEIARFELGAVLLEALEVVGRGAQRLFLRQQEIARVAVLDVDHIAHLAEAADALQENDLHAAAPLLEGGSG